MKKVFEKAGKEAVRSLKKQFADKGLNDTGRTMRGVGHTSTDRGLTVHWPENAHWLIEGRGPGKRPPFGAMLAWVRRKLRPGEENEWIVADTICRNIAENGTAIYRGEKTGLEVETVLAEARESVINGVGEGYAEEIRGKIRKAWKA